jgi:LmbE family N-acetylglucosaminyl deacetylase
VGNRPSQLRREEDAAAAKVLGADILFLNLPDCIYRRGTDGTALYPTGDTLFAPYRTGTDAAQDAHLLLESTLDKLLAKVTHFYFPLAIGNHVDHQIARGWVDALHSHAVNAEIWLYEDYPYSATAGAREQVLASFPPDSIRRYDMMLSPTDVHAKIESIRCYESQLSTFWPDWNTMTAQVKAFLTANGTRSPIETYWIGER